MKRIYVIISSFFGLALLFTLCYYFSYTSALNNFNKKAREINVVDGSYRDQLSKVDTVKIDTVTPFTKIVMKKYDVATGITTSGDEQVTDAIIGYSREDMQGYCDNYMRNIPVNEQNEGLLSFEMEAFSEDKVVLKKTYDSRNCLFKYYMLEQNGYIVIYSNDKKTVYEYTTIQVDTLNASDQKKLAEGIYIKNEQELYTTLEGYSS